MASHYAPRKARFGPLKKIVLGILQFVLGLAVLLVGRLGLHGMWIGMATELCVRGLLMLYRQKTTKYFSLYRKPLSEAENS